MEGLPFDATVTASSHSLHPPLRTVLAIMPQGAHKRTWKAQHCFEGTHDKRTLNLLQLLYPWKNGYIDLLPIKTTPAQHVETKSYNRSMSLKCLHSESSKFRHLLHPSIKTEYHFLNWYTTQNWIQHDNHPDSFLQRENQYFNPITNSDNAMERTIDIHDLAAGNIW